MAEEKYRLYDLDEFGLLNDRGNNLCVVSSENDNGGTWLRSAWHPKDEHEFVRYATQEELDFINKHNKK